MATNNKKKKKQNQNTPIYVLSAVAALLIVAILVLLFIPSCNNTEETTPTSETMLEKIKALNIEENPVATLTMEDGGVIVMELYPEIAPNTVCSFIELANSGYYDNLIFHRCIPGFMIQGGGFDSSMSGMGTPGYNIKGEFTNNGFKNNLKHERGVLSMARTNDPNGAGGQFFIMVESAPHLDGEYAAFGKVISGMEVADAIVANQTDANNKPLEDQVIKSIRVDTKGITYPEAEKIK